MSTNTIPSLFQTAATTAEGFLDNIRVEFEENGAIRADFGDLAGPVWRANVLVTKSNIKIEAIGSGKKTVAGSTETGGLT